MARMSHLNFYCLILAALVVGHRVANAAEAKNYRIEGTSNLTNLIRDSAASWAREKQIGATVSNNGTKAAVQCLKAKKCELGFISQEVANEKENRDALEIQPYAITSVNLIASKDLSVDSLTVEQAKSIFSGKATNWKEIGGPDLTIKVVQRREDSPMTKNFKQKIPITQKYEAIDSVVALFNRFRTPEFKGAISYTGGTVPEHMKLVRLEGLETSTGPRKNSISQTLFIAWNKESSTDPNLMSLVEYLKQVRKELFPKQDLIVP